MALLSRKVDYALLILCDLHQRSGAACAREVAARFGLSRPFVANILKRLCRKGFVKSQRGIKGGYVLGRPAADVKLGELMESLESPFYLTECCRLAAGSCDLMGLCPVRGAIAEVDRRIREVLGSVTLAELFCPCSAGETQFGLEVHLAPRLAAAVAGSPEEG
jgi:Rrf2 family protein